jgi:hypothetical protein
MKRLHGLFAAVAFGLAGVLILELAGVAGAGATPARISRLNPAATGPVPFEAALGGGASASGTQGSAVTVQATGVGMATINDTSGYYLTPTLKITLDITTRPISMSNGSLTATTTNGDELHGTFAGQGTVLDTPGFISIAGMCTFTDGTGRFSGASGTATISGVINVIKLSYVASLKGTITAPHF